MQNFSKHISWSEGIASATGKRLQIANFPPAEIVETMKVTAEKLFEPVREKLGPLRILSFYRCPALNEAVGGSKTSQHKIGEAIDVQGIKVSNSDLFNYIKTSGIDYDQIIWEFGTDREPQWVHMSYTVKRPNRRQALRALKVKGKTQYIQW